MPRLALALLTLAFAAACAAFVAQPGLASFADDSVSYLVMAQVFSPWQAASAPVAAAFAREVTYPPLFPLLLAAAGAAHDIARAHVVSALLLALWLPLAYALGRASLGGRWPAVAAAGGLAILPMTWVHAKGILSEPLFGALFLATLVVAAGERRDAARWIALSLLMAALALTRAAGLIPVAAYALWALTRMGEPLAQRARALLPALAAVAAYGAWVLLRPAEAQDDYLRILREQVPADAGASVLRQLHSMAEAWVGTLLLFWVEGSPARVVLAAAIGLLSLCGLVLRIRAGKADGWMTAAYLATFLAWPFYDQMTRFLFPAVPVLLVYAFVAVEAALARLGRPAAPGHAVLALLIASLALPGLAFIYQRSQAGVAHAAITDWYRTPDLDAARRRSQVHLDLFDDMARIGALTGPADRILWVAPSYVALLAGRHAAPAPPAALAPEEYRRAVLASRASHFFLSAYHPRDTIRDAAWRAGTAAMTGHGAVLHSRPGAALLIKLPARQGG